MQTPVLSTGGGASQECLIPSLPGVVTCPHRWGRALTCPHCFQLQSAAVWSPVLTGVPVPIASRSRVLQCGHLSSQMGTGTNLSPSLPGPEHCSVVTCSSPPPQPHTSPHKSSPAGRRPLAAPRCSGEGSQDSDLTFPDRGACPEHAHGSHLSHMVIY